MNKRKRNWILIIVATAIILAVGYSSRWNEEEEVLDGEMTLEPQSQTGG
jgi:hypothetical protein